MGWADAAALRIVAKVGLLEDRGLHREVEAIRRVSGLVPCTSIVEVSALQGRRVMVTSAAAGYPTHDIGTALEVATQLARVGVNHGDFAPWNILSTPQGAVLIDWESFSEPWRPLQDMIHFLYQSARLLRSMDHEAFLTACLDTNSWCDRLRILTGSSVVLREALLIYVRYAPPDRFRRKVLLAMGEAVS
jgi:hypothetical protein